MFVEPLGLTTPLAAFNGGLLVDPDMNAIEEKTIRVDLAAPIIDLLHGHGLSVWVYQGADWFVLDKDGPHVQHESRGCVCAPTKLASFEGVDDGITKVVGVSDDASAGAAAGDASDIAAAIRIAMRGLNVIAIVLFAIIVSFEAG